MNSGEKQLIINSKHFSFVVNKLRQFFLDRGFIEVHTQNRLSILAACEDPSTIQTFNYNNNVYPLPQTGQMWLEYELLTNPEPNGYFCVSTSYRNELNPIPDRHCIIFPMFEFEMKGGMEALRTMEEELLTYLGYNSSNFYHTNYQDQTVLFDTTDLSHEEEQKMYATYGASVFLENFPEYTSPFWNMARNNETQTANKIDVILSGMETIGSAERSTDKDDMRERFATISEGKYSQILYDKFGKERVDAELDEFLNYSFFPRSGGGIGVTRLIHSMLKEGLMNV